MKHTYTKKEALRIIIAAAKDGKPQKNSVFFYRKCLDNTITEDEVGFRKDGTTPLKLEALPNLIRFLRFSKMTAIYNGTRSKLAVDRIAGTTNYCLGFVKDRDYYVLSSCLLEDIRKLGDRPSQILAVLSKKADRSEPVYKNVCYTAKGIDLARLKLTESLNRRISLDSYASRE